MFIPIGTVPSAMSIDTRLGVIVSGANDRPFSILAFACDGSDPLSMCARFSCLPTLCDIRSGYHIHLYADLSNNPLYREGLPACHVMDKIVETFSKPLFAGV